MQIPSTFFPGGTLVLFGFCDILDAHGYLRKSLGRWSVFSWACPKMGNGLYHAPWVIRGSVCLLSRVHIRLLFTQTNRDYANTAV